jgi:hypothetical protein
MLPCHNLKQKLTVALSTEKNMNHATSPGLLWKMDTASAKEIIMIPVTTSICADLLEEKKQCAISPKPKQLNN